MKTAVTTIEQLLTPGQVAERLSVCRSVVRELILAGSLKAIVVKQTRHEKMFRIRPADLEQWLTSRQYKK